MQGGVWFTISLGRKQRADPKFLLPMICNAGGVTKRDVGAIRIDDTETRFEISADKAAAYAERIRQPGSLERGIMIAPAGEAGGKPRQEKPRQEKPRDAKPKFKEDGKPGRKHKGPPPDRGKKPKHKGRSRSGRGDQTKIPESALRDYCDVFLRIITSSASVRLLYSACLASSAAATTFRHSLSAKIAMWS